MHGHHKQCKIYTILMFISLKRPNFGHLRIFLARILCFSRNPGNFFFGHFFKTQNWVLWEKSERSNDWIWRNWSKWPFLGQNGNFLRVFGPKNSKTEIFSPKSENVTSVHSWSCNFVQETRKILWTDSEI